MIGKQAQLPYMIPLANQVGVDGYQAASILMLTMSALAMAAVMILVMLSVPSLVVVLPPHHLSLVVGPAAAIGLFLLLVLMQGLRLRALKAWVVPWVKFPEAWYLHSSYWRSSCP